MSIGPFSFPAGLLALLAGLLLGIGAARRLAADPARAERALWIAAAAGIACARIAFVIRYRAIYLGQPLGIADIRDGGFSTAAGVAAALVAAAWFAWRDRSLHSAMAGGLMAGFAAFALVLGLDANTSASDSLPNLTLARLDGGQRQLASFAGKPVVLNLWASWCPPCRREMPVLVAAQRSTPGATFVFVNQGEQAAAVRAYFASPAAAPGNVLLDPSSSLGQALHTRALPTTLFFDARGRLVDRRMGELSAATLAQRLEAIGAAAAR